MVRLKMPDPGSLSPALPPLVVLAVSAMLAGCVGEAVPNRTLEVEALGPVPAASVAWLPHLRANDGQLGDAARAIAAGGDAAARREASRRLVDEARGVSSAPWCEAAREAVVRANAAARLEPSPKQLEAQLDQYRDESLLRLLAALEVVGGLEGVAYAFALAENEAASTAVRQAALLVLKKHLDPRDAAARARASALWTAISARAAEESAKKPAAHPVANASSVVAGMAAGFRRCYNRGLRESAEMKGTVRVTAKIGARGEILSVSSSGSGLSAAVVACVEARVAAAQFEPPEGGGATVVIPVTFTTADPQAATPRPAPSGPAPPAPPGP